MRSVSTLADRGRQAGASRWAHAAQVFKAVPDCVFGRTSASPRRVQQRARLQPPQPRSRNRIGLRTRKWKLPPGRRSRQSWSAERIPSLQSRPERRLLLGKITVDRGHSVPRMGAAASTSLKGGRSDTTISSASCLLKQTSGLKELNRHFAQLCRNFVVESEGRHRSFCETSAAESGNCVARL